MRRGKILIALLAGCLLLGGCGGQIPDLTEEQMNEITHYAAGLLLRYDSNYDSGIMSMEELARAWTKEVRKQMTPTPFPEVDQEEDNTSSGSGSEDLIGGGASDMPVDNRTLAEFFGLSGVEITYGGFSIVESYPDDDADNVYFAMDALPGNRLLILHFDVRNLTQEMQTVDILHQDARFRIFINNGSQINAQTTLLTDDLKSINTTLNAGESISQVVVVEITEEEASILLAGQNYSLDFMARTNEDSLRMRLEGNGSVETGAGGSESSEGSDAPSTQGASLSYTLPNGFTESSDMYGMYYGPDYPADTSNIYIYSVEDDPVGLNYTEEAVMEALLGTYVTMGYDIGDINMREFRLGNLNGYDTLYIDFSYSLEGMEIEQIEYMIQIGRTTHAMVFTTFVGSNYLNDFRDCVNSVSVVE